MRARTVERARAYVCEHKYANNENQHGYVWTRMDTDKAQGEITVLIIREQKYY